eukprot:gb/GECH01011439.1/.p1 GENE.gb/GECH01011439.1/~~gb/GECH01011439.1/.p1  ORF type:complete len:314 (+),score=78.89 gb/GECH01011439.1/:1-942(+)
MNRSKHLLYFCIIIVILSVSLYSIEGKKCHAIALGGGGDRGAYEAGAVSALVENLSKEDVEWTVVSGISAGSLNAAGISMFKVGDEKSAANFLLERWKTISKDDVYKNWAGSIVEGFFVKSGLFNTSPLYSYLQKMLDSSRIRNSGRQLVIGATDISTYRYTEFNQTDPNIPLACLASSAVPGVFPVVDKGSNAYVDGGVTYMTPVSSAIQECQKHGDEVTVDVILAIGDTLEPAPNDHLLTTPFVLMRSLFKVVADIFVKDIESARQAFPEAKIRVVAPSKWLPGWFLGFGHSNEMIKIGYRDALHVIHHDN